jgi:predicted HTH transcriptional regulator
MDATELIKLISSGEDSRTQLKENVTNPTSLAGELVAFSNSRGGRIFIGVTNLGEIAGLSSDDVRRINQLVSNTATNLVRPSVNLDTENISTADGKLVMVITVIEGLSKPYSDNDGVFWVKSGSDKRRITSREELQRMFQNANIVHADEVPVTGTTTEEIDMDHFREFFERQYHKSLNEVLNRDGIPLIQLLNNLGLAREDTLNLAGLLLFGRQPQRHRPVFVVKAVSFVGNNPEGTQYRESENIVGCLRDLHKGTLSFFNRNLRRLQFGRNVNSQGDLEVPVTAMEELVANMLMHRDYFISAPWRVMIFDNRIELISPGSLPNNLTVENVRHGVSIIRNPLITSFAQMGELPYWGMGTGIRRALAAVPRLKLESDHGRNLFIARIPREEI